MRIGELAKRTALSRDTIRFYEKNGLIVSRPGGGETNNYRDYGEENLLTVEIITQAKAAGFTLSDLVVFTSQLAAQDGSDFDGQVFLQEKIEEVAVRIARLEKFLETLQTTLVALADASKSS